MTATPELIKEDTGEFILVHNHYLESRESLELSTSFTLARIRHVRAHLPLTLQNARVVFDTAGQSVSANDLERMQSSLAEDASIEFRTK